jgi:hypothetical protein
MTNIKMYVTVKIHFLEKEKLFTMIGLWFVGKRHVGHKLQKLIVTDLVNLLHPYRTHQAISQGNGQEYFSCSTTPT